MLGTGSGRRRLTLASAGMLAVLLVVALDARVAAGRVEQQVAGTTTADLTIRGNPTAPFSMLGSGPGERHLVREEIAKAQRGRGGRRVSIAYFGQVSDFQLADVESPARFELFDAEPLREQVAASGYRPQEGLVAHAVDSIARQINLHLRSPIAQRNGRRAELMNVVLTGDLADNMQRNEVEWLVRLIEGGPMELGSGAAEESLCSTVGLEMDRPRRYTGVQDYNDYYESPLFWDPNRPFGRYADFPRYPGLMERAQEAFIATGLPASSYIALGNHDVLVQGTTAALAPFETIATGCVKPAGPVPDVSDPGQVLDPAYLSGLQESKPGRVVSVPPDRNRQFVDRAQYKELVAAGGQPDAHGFAYVKGSERRASAGAATYYAFTPVRGVRFIVLDTNSAGAGPLEDQERGGSPSEGNIDNPQFVWLRREVHKAETDGELVIAFGHHPIWSLTYAEPDENAGPCEPPDEHGHGLNPGCDLDPRDSRPVHDGAELRQLLGSSPNVLAYIAGHTHQNQIRAIDPEGPGRFWAITTPGVADWPSQARLLELMDNRDGTLSLFGTLINSAAPIEPPAPGTGAKDFRSDELASIARVITFNDPDRKISEAEGKPEDRNVELLLDDPRGADLKVSIEDDRNPVRAGDKLTYTVEVKNLGLSQAAEPRVVLKMPAPMKALKGRTSGGRCTTPGRKVVCKFRDLPPRNVARAKMVVVPPLPGTYRVLAIAKSITHDPRERNNVANETTTVKRPRR